MRWRTLPVELLLLAFLAVFLLYPLAYILPGSASDEEYHVRLVGFSDDPGQRAQALAVLHKALPDAQVATGLKLPQTVRTFPSARSAEQLADQLRRAGADARVVRERRWTGFYFQQALGFRLESASGFPYVQVVPNSPMLWECLRSSLAVAVVTTLGTTLLCLPLAYWLTRFRVPGRGVLGALLLVPLIVPPFVGAIGLERLFNRFGTLNLLLMDLGLLDPG